MCESNEKIIRYDFSIFGKINKQQKLFYMHLFAVIISFLENIFLEKMENQN